MLFRILLISLFIFTTITSSQIFAASESLKQAIASKKSQKITTEIYRANRDNTLDNDSLNLIAEHLWQNYSTATSDDADSYAWMLKVLGKSSEPRFINLITEILNKTHDKKIQKYAKSALKEQKKLARKHLRTQNKAEIQQYVKGSYELKPIYDSYVAPTQYEAKKGLSFEQLMQYKLIHSELRPLKKVIMTMFKNNESNPNILDVLAERIYQMNEELETFEVDTIAWGAKVLGQSNNNRYKTILTSILTSNFDNRSYKKHIGKAVKTLSREEKVEQYQPNEISLEKLRDEISVAI